jgi:hypothetical protein
MFGLPSFPKLTLLILVLAAVWFAFRWIGKQDRARKEEAGGRAPRGRGRNSAEAVDMVQCKVCDAFVPRANPTACERAGCPY